VIVAKRPSFFHHLHPPTIPAREARFRYTFGLGGTAVFLFVVLAITGALELFYYVPSIDEANRSLHLINLRVPYGQLIRSLHYWSAQALVVVSLLHLLRVTLTGGYKAHRAFNWLLGLILLVLVLLLDFTGYALRWDQDIAWAIEVGTNLLKTIPLIGHELYAIVVGGPAINAGTIVRFYGWHIFGLAVAALGFISWHIFQVRRDGGISYIERDGERPARISRDVLVRREALAALLITIGLLVLAILFPPPLGSTADFDSIPTEAAAPWFFIWVQQLLRLGSPLLMGVVIPGILLLLLLLVPYVFDRSAEGGGRYFNRSGRRAQLVLLIIIVFVLGFTLQALL
jgi:quinol-cytochrome oxidoreductase complex cytochrome b subunit